MYMLIIRNAKLSCYFLRCFPNITRKILTKIHCFINSNLNKDKACVTYKYFKPSIRKFKCKNYFKFIRIFKSTFFYENHGKTYFYHTMIHFLLDNEMNHSLLPQHTIERFCEMKECSDIVIDLQSV